MNRRIFIKKGIAGSALISLAPTTMASCGKKKGHLTILHTNDVHSRLDPFPATHSRNANMGGVSRRAVLIDKIRKENPNTLLFDAGDIFQGTPYFNYYGGELEFKLMTALKYDAATLGNHDFDNGIEGLYAQLPFADFKLLCTNYDFTNTIMQGYTRPWMIFDRGGIKTGVFGLGIKLNGLVSSKLYKETIYLSPFEIAQDMGRFLKKEKNCDLVVCLSHLGYEYRSPDKPSDVMLARQSQFIDVIIGGHTHTFLKEPALIPNMKGENVIVNQVGAYGIYLGRLDFYFDETRTHKATILGV